MVENSHLFFVLSSKDVPRKNVVKLVIIQVNSNYISFSEFFGNFWTELFFLFSNFFLRLNYRFFGLGFCEYLDSTFPSCIRIAPKSHHIFLKSSHSNAFSIIFLKNCAQIVYLKTCLDFITMMELYSLDIFPIKNSFHLCFCIL